MQIKRQRQFNLGSKTTYQINPTSLTLRHLSPRSPPKTKLILHKRHPKKIERLLQHKNHGTHLNTQRENHGQQTPHGPCAASLKAMFELKGQVLFLPFFPLLNYFSFSSWIVSPLSLPAPYFQSFYSPGAPSLTVSFRDEYKQRRILCPSLRISCRKFLTPLNTPEVFSPLKRQENWGAERQTGSSYIRQSDQQQEQG